MFFKKRPPEAAAPTVFEIRSDRADAIRRMAKFLLHYQLYEGLYDVDADVVDVDVRVWMAQTLASELRQLLDRKEVQQLLKDLEADDSAHLEESLALDEFDLTPEQPTIETLREQFGELRRTVNAVFEAEANDRDRLLEAIAELRRTNEALAHDASELASRLSAPPTAGAASAG